MRILLISLTLLLSALLVYITGVTGDVYSRYLSSIPYLIALLLVISLSIALLIKRSSLLLACSLGIASLLFPIFYPIPLLYIPGGDDGTGLGWYYIIWPATVLLSLPSIFLPFFIARHSQIPISQSYSSWRYLAFPIILMFEWTVLTFLIFSKWFFLIFGSQQAAPDRDRSAQFHRQMSYQ